MFSSFVFNKAGAEYESHVLLFDFEGFDAKTSYSDYFQSKGFQVIRYQDDLHFRAEHSEALYAETGKFLLLVEKECYVPYDIRKRFHSMEISIAALFPKLKPEIVQKEKDINYDLLVSAYTGNFYELQEEHQTLHFIRDAVYGESNVNKYLRQINAELHEKANGAKSYKDWMHIVNLKVGLDVMAAKMECGISTEDINDVFAQRFVLPSFGTLSGVVDADGPVLVSRAMEYMRAVSNRFAVIVMDGMSEFDWKIFAQGFRDYRYIKSDVFAMVPTTTSISRQCLLSGKFPVQLSSPWNQAKEKAEFLDCAQTLDFKQQEIFYGRGYDVDFGSSVKCAAVIVNDVDDTLHAQKRGRKGMLDDISALSKSGKLVDLAANLLSKGLDVYITADHGNTPCRGIGKLPQTGVTTETKSKRMMVLKNFADKEVFIQKYGMLEFPKTFLCKEYEYLVCGTGTSFDPQGELVMSHGGITLDEVIVTFIRIKTEDN